MIHDLKDKPPHQPQKSKELLTCFRKPCKSCSAASIDAIPDRRPSILKDLDDTQVLQKVEMTTSRWGMINTYEYSIPMEIVLLLITLRCSNVSVKWYRF